ncbi:tyrosine-protein phosphatase [Maricaulaceae bacterium EIL42A08]|nr:tyrosine-protein phosphatase [Maricaulaceae bacterium EIL42A08]
MTERVYSLAGIHNFRRFDGYEGEGGRKIAPGLYRSGQFSRATDDDKAFLEELGISVVADLRRPSERANEPSHWPEVAGVTVIESDHAGPAEAPHITFLREADLTFDTIREFMTATYKRLPFDEGNQHVFREGIKALAERGEDEAFVVHCAAGKDRTGIFCALVLSEAGVDHDAVVEDYLMTNTAVDFDRVAASMRGRLEEKYGRVFRPEELKAFLGIDKTYLDAAWAVMGDPRQYLRDTLGIDETTLQRMRERLLAS